jgi:hypothetical protein
VLTAPATDIAAIEPPARPASARTLADVRDVLLQAGDAAGQKTKLLISAINTVARASGCAPDDLPADPARLRQQLATLSPAMAGLTRGSWSSVRSRVLKALQRAEVQVMAGRRTYPLSEAWAQLYRSIDRKGRQASLSGFISYLSDRGSPPDQVSDAVIERFAAELETSSLRRNPRGVVRAAIRGWNAAADTIPGWPQQRLTSPAIERQGYVLSADSFPLTFRRSLDAYLAFLADPPEDDDAPLRGACG